MFKNYRTFKLGCFGGLIFFATSKPRAKCQIWLGGPHYQFFGAAGPIQTQGSEA